MVYTRLLPLIRRCLTNLRKKQENLSCVHVYGLGGGVKRKEIKRELSVLLEICGSSIYSLINKDY